jgi:hypothetical protein
MGISEWGLLCRMVVTLTIVKAISRLLGHFQLWNDLKLQFLLPLPLLDSIDIKCLPIMMPSFSAMLLSSCPDVLPFRIIFSVRRGPPLSTSLGGGSGDRLPRCQIRISESFEEFKGASR